MCRTFRISTANCMTERQLRSVCTTRLAMFRCTNNSPGATPTIWFAGTRLSEQPIHKYFGDCCRERLRKKSGSCCRIFSDQSRLFSNKWVRDSMRLRSGHETHLFWGQQPFQARAAPVAKRVNREFAQSAFLHRYGDL